MRNILIGADQRVMVLDTPPNYVTAVYDDIAAFLIDLEVSRLTALGRGAPFHTPRIAEYRNAFLRGYFDSAPVPDEALRIYEIQALLERWSAEVARCAGARRPPLARAKLSLLSPFLRAAIVARLRQCGARADRLAHVAAL
jgi:hypothetical protein